MEACNHFLRTTSAPPPRKERMNEKSSQTYVQCVVVMEKRAPWLQRRVARTDAALRGDEGADNLTNKDDGTKKAIR